MTTGTADIHTRAGGRLSLPLVAVIAATGWLALLAALAWGTAGTFEYPLDDVYIHLAMADGLLSGEYGVNAGETASAASSPIYPVLLSPFAGTPFFVVMPFVLNLLGLVLAALLWGRLVELSGATGPLALVLAMLGPVALNMPAIALLGMEHALHGAATLAALVGLVRLLRDGTGAGLLALGVILGPMLRLEGLAVSASVCLVLLLHGRWRLGLALGIAALVPVAVFCGILTALGVGPLPNSVMAKLAGAQSLDQGFAVRILHGISDNLGDRMGMVLALLGVVLAAQVGQRDRAVRAVAIAGGCVVLLHLCFGQIGWANRYENYALVFAGGAFVFTLVQSEVPLRAWAAAVFLLLPLGTYTVNFLRNGIAAPRAIHLQQAQMARFAKDYVAAPVAVNDIGWVAFRNPHYVLDLWGLASRAALRARLSGDDPGWADRMAEEHGADLAMIYSAWLGGEIGSDWVRLGTLRIEGRKGYVAAPEVAFFATRPGAVEPLRAALDDFAPTLPEGATFAFASE